MRVTHEPWLVALSIVVAIQGAYVGLSLAVQVAEAAGVRRRLLLAGAALSLARRHLVDALRRHAGGRACRFLSTIWCCRRCSPSSSA